MFFKFSAFLIILMVIFNLNGCKDFNNKFYPIMRGNNYQNLYVLLKIVNQNMAVCPLDVVRMKFIIIFANSYSCDQIIIAPKTLFTDFNRSISR